MREPVFFSEHVQAAIDGKSPHEQLDALGKLIAEATSDKEGGYGPPADDLTRARRRWLEIYDSIYGAVGKVEDCLARRNVTNA